MTMNMGLIHSIWTLLLLAVFIGIVAWAFSRRRQQSFDAAARLPLEDDDMPDASGDRRHG
jgi:cytochrome c oxidase cbb3-type subunit 4